MTAPMPPPSRRHAAAPEPPDHLETPERDLWRDITAAFTFSDPASLALLTAALEAHQRGRRCRQTVTEDGETFKDRWGQLRPHPLLAPERDARAAFLSAMKALNLDLGDSK